jgi:hypothetical protein
VYGEDINQPEQPIMTNNNIELKIAKQVVTDALAAGYTVSVYDGGEWTVKRSTNKATIVAALASTDSDNLRFRDAAGNIVGTVVLIWGNGQDLISDYSDNAATSAILRRAMATADRV